MDQLLRQSGAAKNAAFQWNGYRMNIVDTPGHAAEVGVAGCIDDVDAVVVPGNAAFLARIVIPFSRSRSFESMTRSSIRRLERKVPDCWSNWSTSVVLP